MSRYAVLWGLLGVAAGCESAPGEARRVDEVESLAAARQAAGQRRWCHAVATVTELGASPAAIVAIADAIVIAGHDLDDVDRPWLIALRPDGELAWRLDLSPGLELRDLAGGPAATSVFATGVVPASTAGAAQAWFAELELETGARIRELDYGAPENSIRPSAIAVDEAGLWLAGSAGGDAWLARFDGDGDLVWERRFDSAGGLDRSYAVLALGHGRALVAGNASARERDPLDDDPRTEVFVRVHDEHGELELDVCPAGVSAPEHGFVDAVAWDDAVLVGGSRGEVFPASVLWSISGDGGIAPPATAPDPLRVISTLARNSTAVFAAGTRHDRAGASAQWLARFSPDLRSYAWERVDSPGQIVALAASDEPAVYAAILIPRERGGSDTTICKFSE